MIKEPLHRYLYKFKRTIKEPCIMIKDSPADIRALLSKYRPFLRMYGLFCGYALQGSFVETLCG